MDSWVEDDGAKYVRHYLMDFGATLGSASYGPMPAHIGFENAFDPKEMSKKLVTLGLHVRSYELPYTIEYTSIGRFTSDNFFPHRYKFIRPNPAFDRATFRDEFWGAKLVMSFTDDQIDAVVKQGQYSDRNAERYLATVLKERRDIIGRHWFGMVSPLDRFSVVPGNDGYQRLHFTDLAVEGNVADPQTSNYRYSIWYDSKLFIRDQDTKGRLAVSLPDPQTVTGGNGYLSGDDPLIVTVQSRRSGSKWSKAVKVYLTSGADGNLILLGIKR